MLILKVLKNYFKGELLLFEVGLKVHVKYCAVVGQSQDIKMWIPVRRTRLFRLHEPNGSLTGKLCLLSL